MSKDIVKPPVEIISDWMIKNHFATGHGDSVPGLLAELEWQLKERQAAMLNALEMVLKATDWHVDPPADTYGARAFAAARAEIIRGRIR